MIPIARPQITEEEKEEVLRVLDSGMLAAGTWVKSFEEEFAEYVGTRYGVATSSGTTGLHVALRASGIQNGDQVLTTPLSFIATSNAILYCGGKPVFADIDPLTLNLDPRAAEKTLQANPEIKAIVVVHLYGLPARMSEFRRLADDYDLILIEDCAQAHGASIRGRRVGTFGDISVFSFYPTKNMTTGEGGMVLTDDPGLSDECQSLINHGSQKRYLHQSLGYNYRMTNIGAAIGRVQLKRLSELNRRRIENAEWLTAQIEGLFGIRPPISPSDRRHVYNHYTICVDDRSLLISHLEEREIGYGIYYPHVIYRQPFYREMNYSEKLCPEAEGVTAEVLSLPVHPGLEQIELEEIRAALCAYAEERAGSM